MEFPQTYTDLYIRYTEWRPFNLVFHNKNSGDVLVFGGIFFAFIPNSDFDDSLFAKLEYTDKMGGIIELEAITSDYDTSYIKFTDGNIFQLFYMTDHVDSKQLLTLYTPLERNYRLAINRLNSLEIAEIKELEEGTSVLEWLKIKSS
ncbi:hypothetical protein JMG10_02675 [Nostoc ellipsosporum NOK]|nr:hypothetical protein [Nostoc ellipsosporum NOK]